MTCWAVFWVRIMFLFFVYKENYRPGVFGGLVIIAECDKRNRI